tara:strand:+ start:9896 stop:12292 length:2397 start_codon:yes stop_codon:yes gene_type:complete
MAKKSNRISLLKEELGWVDKLSSAEQSRADKLKELARLTGQRTEILTDALMKLNKQKEVSEAIKGLNEEMIQLSIKQKVIKDKQLQNSKFAQERAKGIVDAEEQLLDVIRQQKLEQDPAYKTAQKKLDLAKKQIEREKEITEWTEKWTDKWDDFKAITSDPKVAGGLFLAAMTNEAGKFAKTLEGAAENIGMSKTQGYELAGTMGAANLQGALFGISAQQNADAMAGLVEGAGDLNDLSGNAVVQVANIARNIGLGEKEAGKLVGHMSLVEGMTIKQSKATLETTANLARGAKLPIGKVMKDVADNMELTSKFGNISVKQLGKMAVEAGKLGTSLTQMASLSEKLLDIDTARASAMELSVMLGRQINVDKAQQLAYEGDIEGAYKEMLGQLGGIQQFNQMDYYQKKQAAELMGVTTAELEKQLNKAAGLTETGEKHASGWAKVGEATSRYGGYLKENAVTLAATGNLMGAMVKNVGSFAPALKGLGSKIGSKLGLGGGGAPDPAPKLDDADKLGKGGKKGGVKNKMKDLAAGFKALGKGGVLKGILALALAGPALLLALPSIPFLLFMGMVPLAMLASNFKFLAQGLKSLGKGFSSILKGLLVLGLLGIAMIPAALAFKLLAGVDPLAMITFSAAIVILGLAAAGLGFAFPMVALGAAAMALIGLAIIPFAFALKMIPADLDLLGFAAGTAALGLAGLTLMPGALGFIMMAGALTLFAYSLLLLVPLMPVLDKLGSIGIIGGKKEGVAKTESADGGGNSEIIEKLDELISVIQAGGKVVMDGKEVGKVIQLASGPIGA